MTARYANFAFMIFAVTRFLMIVDQIDKRLICNILVMFDPSACQTDPGRLVELLELAAPVHIGLPR
jgi:hypothetical protein